MFRALTCPSSGGEIVLSQHLVSSLSINGCTVCRTRADCSAYCWRIKELCIKLFIETSLYYDARSEKNIKQVFKLFIIAGRTSNQQNSVVFAVGNYWKQRVYSHRSQKININRLKPSGYCMYH